MLSHMPTCHRCRKKTTRVERPRQETSSRAPFSSLRLAAPRRRRQHVAAVGLSAGGSGLRHCAASHRHHLPKPSTTTGAARSGTRPRRCLSKCMRSRDSSRAQRFRRTSAWAECVHAATPSPWRANEYVSIRSQGKRAKDNCKRHRRRHNTEAGETGAS
jgi:hypothetical protein